MFNQTNVTNRKCHPHRVDFYSQLVQIPFMVRLFALLLMFTLATTHLSGFAAASMPNMQNTTSGMSITPIDDLTPLFLQSGEAMSCCVEQQASIDNSSSHCTGDCVYTMPDAFLDFGAIQPVRLLFATGDSHTLKLVPLFRPPIA